MEAMRRLPRPATDAIACVPRRKRRCSADLYYNQYRDYDSTTGRYIQADPIGLAGDANPYSYANSNPVGMVDPMGLSARDWCGSEGSEIVPDGNWAAACAAHDRCYATPGSNKELCDARLGRDIILICSTNFARPIPLPICAYVGLSYSCILIGTGWQFGVNVGPSRVAFRRAQPR